MNYQEKCRLAKLIVTLNRAKTVEQKEQIKAQIQELEPSPEDLNSILEVIL